MNLTFLLSSVRFFSIFQNSRHANNGFSRRKKGQAMVEFALILPLLLMIVGGTVEMGFILNDYLTLIQANAAATRVGSMTQGRPDANIQVLQHLLQNRNQLDQTLLTVYGATGNEVGSFTISDTGEPLNADGSSVVLPLDTFFMYDNNTPDNLNDDYPMNCTDINVSYVKVTSIYQHPIMLPGVNAFVTDSVFPISVENVYPCNILNIDLTDPAVDIFSVAMPITIKDIDFVPSQSYVLKGKSDEETGSDRPGNFGWMDLEPTIHGGNPNSRLASWILGAAHSPVVVPGPADSFPGQRNAKEIKDALAQVQGRYAVVFLHDSNIGTGAHLQYNEIGYAIFKLENFTEQTGGGNPYLEIEGTFVKKL